MREMGKFGSSGLLFNSDYLEQNHDDIFGEYLTGNSLKTPTIDDLTGSFKFFRPDDEFIKWLVEYAENRVVIDVGCGSGHITAKMTRAGAKMVGIDPFMDMNTILNVTDSLMRDGFSAHLLPWTIEKAMGLFKGQGNKVLLMYCRPCHSDFVQQGIEMADDSTEILYITKPSVILDHDDLGRYESYAELIPHKGFSVEGEKVWSIRKGDK